MTDLNIIQAERNRQLYLLAEATNKSVRKTLRSSIHLFDGLRAQQRVCKDVRRTTWLVTRRYSKASG